MPQLIEVPGMGQVEFPDGMSDEQIVAAIRKNSPAKPADAGARTMNAFAGFNKGVAGLAGLPVDTVQNVGNLISTGFTAGKNLLTGAKNSPALLEGSLGSSRNIENFLNRIGSQTENTNPGDMASRMLHTGGQIIGGSMVPGARPVSTLAAATGGAVASEIDPRLTALGAIAPSAIRGLATAATQLPAETRQTIQAFKNAGAQPSLGLATDNTFFNGIENLLSKFPGGAGVMSKFREKLQGDLGKSVSTGVSAEQAGAAIERGITGPGGFLEKTSAVWKALDQKIAAKVPKGTAIAPSETVKALDELTTPTAGAEQTTGALANPKLLQMKENLTADLAATGQLPFEALRTLRTRVGSMLENSIISGVPNGELKRLYKGISADLEAAANAGGAGREFARQQAYWQARMGRVERVLDRVIGSNKNPEEIFKTFYPSDVTQFSKTAATMRSLPADERRIVSQAVVDRLGRATPGKQNEYGDVFSSETYLTNYAKLNPKVKAVLFPDDKMRANVEAVAQAASKIRHGGSAFSNPSGTAGSFAAYSIYASPVASLASGSVVPMATAAGAMGLAKITARMMTSPQVIEWMARAPQGNPKAVAAHLARLSVIYNSTQDDALKEDLGDYIQSMNGEQ